VLRWTTLVYVLLGSAALPAMASAQTDDRRHDGARRRGRLQANEPNPFTRETTIPFRVGSESCAPGSERHVVTLHVYNILSQLVAVPVLVRSTSGPALRDDSAATAAPVPVAGVELACGMYAARWNGRHDRDARPAAPGVYMIQLVIDGHASGMRKMLLSPE
jgi:hypothetical protein